MNTEFILGQDICDEVYFRMGEILRGGGLVVFPTETVYGLGANALDSMAAKKIYAAKGRPSDNPLIVHIAAPEDAEKYAVVCDEYKLLASAFMPGPLTVILPKKDCIPDTVTGGLDSVGVRCPENPIARKLICAAGVPIAAPSANLSGKPSPTTAEHVRADLDGKVDAILDGGKCRVGLESTIVKITDRKLTLLRPGAITPEMLLPLFPDMTVSEAVTEKLAEGKRPLSPGMKYRHYAPSAPLYLIDADDEKRLSYFAAADAGTLLLVYDGEEKHLAGHKTISLGSKTDLGARGARLFAALREADNLGCDRILAPLPEKAGLSLALYNRMIRAAAHTVIKL